MLDILGSSNGGYCDGLSRRNVLQAGAMGLAGLTLADVLRAEDAAGTGSSQKAIINIHLAGGPSHQDMWDLKPDAPVEYRGEFSPIKTNVPGMDICELYPQLAKRADKFALIRGLIGSVNEHSNRTALTGYRRDNLLAVGGRPSQGSVIAKVYEKQATKAPAFVSLMGRVEHGYLGPIYSPYAPDGVGRTNLQLSRDVPADRLRGRTSLLSQLDRIKRQCDQTGKMDALDAFGQRAVDVITSGKMADALDINKEKPETVKRYLGKAGKFTNNRNLLMARRMVEAGVRCVAMSWGGWDTHGNNFISLRKHLPQMDAGLSALLDDLTDRGMLDDVTVVVWGEFGRTPRVNSKAGRDHWPRVAAAWIAGGGIKAGQVVGKSDRIAGEAEVPVHLHNVHATLYHNVGIDTRTMQFVDPAGRPQYLLDRREPLRELV